MIHRSTRRGVDDVDGARANVGDEHPAAIRREVQPVREFTRRDGREGIERRRVQHGDAVQRAVGGPQLAPVRRDVVTFRSLTCDDGLDDSPFVDIDERDAPRRDIGGPGVLAILCERHQVAWLSGLDRPIDLAVRHIDDDEGACLLRRYDDVLSVGHERDAVWPRVAAEVDRPHRAPVAEVEHRKRAPRRPSAIVRGDGPIPVRRYRDLMRPVADGHRRDRSPVGKRNDGRRRLGFVEDHERRPLRRGYGARAEYHRGEEWNSHLSSEWI